MSSRDITNRQYGTLRMGFTNAERSMFRLAEGEKFQVVKVEGHDTPDLDACYVTFERVKE